MNEGLRQATSVVATVLALANVVPYVLSILRGKTRPSTTSYLIWVGLDVIGLAGYVTAGAGLAALPRAAFTATGLTVLLLSFRFGVRKLTRVDILCLLLAVAAVVGWVWSGAPAVAVYLSAFGSLVGYVPTLTKLCRMPGTEDMTSWLLTSTAGVLNLLIVPSLAPVVVLPPAVSMATSTSVVLLILAQRRMLVVCAQCGTHARRRDASSWTANTRDTTCPDCVVERKVRTDAARLRGVCETAGCDTDAIFALLRQVAAMDADDAWALTRTYDEIRPSTVMEYGPFAMFCTFIYDDFENKLWHSALCAMIQLAEDNSRPTNVEYLLSLAHLPEISRVERGSHVAASVHQATLAALRVAIVSDLLETADPLLALERGIHVQRLTDSLAAIGINVNANKRKAR